ncbi:MAG TPA: EAL domain-containing protein [Thermoanaerobaculia bacterium]|nr:EAL domain-containing protein [Thermoanaerobaculia bacterium]
MSLHLPEYSRPRSSRLAKARRDFARWFRALRAAGLRSPRTTVAVLKAQQEAMLDGVLVVDPDGKVLSYNRRFLEIWGIPENVAASADDEHLLQYAAQRVADWNSFIDEVTYLYKHPNEIRTGDPIPLKDGRTLMRGSVPVIADGKCAGRAWHFRDVTESRRVEGLQAALFRIAQMARETSDLAEFYPEIHAVIQTLMEASNFYIAEYDAARNILSYPYFVDAYDPAPEGEPPGRGCTAFVLRTGKPLLATPEVFDRLCAEGEIELVGHRSMDWLGAPLRTGERTWGVIGVQTYEADKRLTTRDKEILVFVAQQVASAIDQKRQETALRENERRYRQMFENNRAVQLILDPDSGAIIDANVAASEYYGWSVERLRSMKIWDINLLEQEHIRREMANAARQDRSVFEFRHRVANGAIRDVEVHSGPVEIGPHRYLYSIIHDVTERRQAEKALAASEEKYRNIFNFASVGIFQATVDGRLTTANNALARMLGYDSPDELLRMNLAEVYLNPEERHADLIAHAASGEVAETQVLWRKKNGTPLWVQINAHMVHDEDEPPLFESFVYDITERRMAEQQLASANAQRKAVLDAATGVSIIATDAEGIITVFNSGAERMLGYKASDVIGRRSVIDLHRPEELEDHANRLQSEFGYRLSGFDIVAHRADREGIEEREWTYVKSDATAITVLLSVTSLRRDDGWLTGFLHVANDVTERKRAEETLQKQSAAMTASMDGIGIVNHRLELTVVNDALAKLYGYADPRQMIGLSLHTLYEPSTYERFTSTILPIVKQRGKWRGEAPGLRHDGLTFPQEISISAIEGGGFVCVARDITERTYAEEQIKHLAYHDALTGLPNRLLFKDRLTVAISHAQRERSKLAVLFLDLDRFKVINDSLGHNIGDQLLQAVSARVQSCVRESDTVARLGGDEFTILLPHLFQGEDAALVAQKIIDAVRYPFQIEGREFFMTTSIGISLYPDDGFDAETLIKNADTAMYQAKEQGRDNYQLFNAFINAKALQRIALEHGLRKALANNELAVYYQPIFDFRTGRISGMEALLRWNHPTLGMIPPSVFIPLAEAIGVMIPIGGWALRAACAQAKAWHDAGHRALSLAVNLSVVQLQQPDLVQSVREILQETGLPPRLLELEITESSAMQSPETSVRTLYELKKLGVRISLDDFGTGHSSLSYLKRFPIDTLKIDQSFVRDITHDPDTAAIVTAIIAMAHSLRLKVIAEGVEFTEQSSFLKKFGCDQMQGYLIKAPVPAEKFIELLTAAPDDVSAG